MIGQTIAHYRILAHLGTGGMGEVYLAEDAKLDRKVALKFLPAQVSAQPDAKARFLQEARAASALNHPNICTIHDIQDQDGQMFIVMEYVEGKTLRDYNQPFSLKQVIEIGIQVADGLAAAHEKGIIHRDIKTENIMIRKDGIVQIMDFGLAKLRGASRLTKEGSTIGTVGYMSPEQVQGLDADHRTDLFSLGVVLYELIAGQLPFKGVHETAIMYEIVNVDPQPLSAIKPDFDPELDRIILDCLQKDPDERCQSAREISRDLRRFKVDSGRSRASRVFTIRPAFNSSVSRTAGPSSAVTMVDPAPTPSTAKKYLPWGIAFLAVAGLLASLLFRSKPAPVERAPIRFTVSLPKNQRLDVDRSDNLALSPNGRMLVLALADSTGTPHLWLRPLESFSAQLLSGTEGASMPFWSPDGRTIGFFADRKLKKIEVGGGPPLTICDAVDGRGGTWGQSGVIVFAPDQTTGLYRVSAGGGIASPVTRLDSTRIETTHRWPWFLPDGNHFLYYARSGASGSDERDAIYVGSLDSSTNRILMPHHGNAIYSQGHLLFSREGTLMAQAFDLSRLTVGGDPFPVGEKVFHDARYTNDVFSASASGALVYRESSGSSGSQPIWFDRFGRALDTLGEPAQYINCKLSPDDKRLAVDIADLKSNKSDIWIFEMARRVKTRFTFNTDLDEWLPVWSPDGSQIAYARERQTFLDIYVKPSTGSGAESPLLVSDYFNRPTDWSSDGRYLLYRHRDSAQTQDDAWVLPMEPSQAEGTNKGVSFQSTRFDEDCGVFSPDGRWIAYSSDESGRYEIYVNPFPGPGGKWQVSTKGGIYPVWRRDGKEIFFISESGAFTSAPVTASGSSFEVGQPEILFQTLANGVFPYDVSADGQRLIVITPVGGGEVSTVDMVLNWDEKVSVK